jgi:hypothetical protein
MQSILGCLVLVACHGSPDPAPEAPGSYLITKAPGQGVVCRTCIEPYCPHEGEVILWDDNSLIWKALFLCAGSRPPSHSCIVVLRPDGTPALLEATFNQHMGCRVCLADPLKRMQSFKGAIYVRRLKCPLSPGQSANLTQFALLQEGKRFAFGRMILEGTPFCARGTVRNKCFGKTDLNRSSWMCSELVVAAGTVAGLFDPMVHHANAILPADLLDDRTYDLSGTWMPAAKWSSVPCAPPAR